MANIIYELLKSGTDKTNSDSGSTVARKVNDNTKKIVDKLNEIEDGAEKNLIEIIKIDGFALPVENKTVEIIKATETSLGVVKGTNLENGIAINDDGTLIINNVNINKIIQTDGDSLILESGNSVD